MKLLHAALIATLLAPCIGFSQTDTQPDSQTTAPQPAPATPSQSEEQEWTVGPTAYVEFQGSRSHLGVVMAEDTNLGYNLTEHFGGDIGLPVLFVRTKFSLVNNHDWNWTTLMGQPYIDLRYTNTRGGLRYTSVLTGTAPVASSVRIFGTGRAGGDWFNHIEPEHSFGGLKPFVNFGLSNGTFDNYYMPRPYSMARPYQTLGALGDGEVGLTYAINRGVPLPSIPGIHHIPGIRGFTPHIAPRGITLGASAYGLLPEGTQKIFSRLITPGSSVVGDESRGRYFYGQFEATGPSSIARDNGYSGWIELTRVRAIDVQIAYTRSVKYGNDTVSLMIKLDFTPLIRFVTGREQ